MSRPGGGNPDKIAALVAALRHTADHCERWIAQHGWKEGWAESDAALKLVREHANDMEKHL